LHDVGAEAGVTMHETEAMNANEPTDVKEVASSHDPLLADVFASLADAMVETLERRPELRATLRRFAAWLREIAAEPQPATTEGPADSAPVGVSTETLGGRGELPPPWQTVTLHLGDALTDVAVPRGENEPLGLVNSPSRTLNEPPIRHHPAARVKPVEAPPDLRLVVRRCQLKVETCRWAVERRKRQADRSDFDALIRPTDQRLLSAARSLPNCYVWPLDKYLALPSDLELETAAGCYENLSAAAQLAEEIRGQSEDLQLWAKAYELLAEAQSAVRQMMKSLDLKPDVDQEEVFYWLRQRTAIDGILLQKYMRMDSPADPHAWLGLEARIGELRQQWEEGRSRERERQQLLNKARYHCRKLSEARGEDSLADWERLISACVGLLELGMKPSNVEIRELLLPIIDEMPEEVGQDEAFSRIVAEIDRYLCSRESDRQDAAAGAVPEPVVQQAAQLLGGRAVVLIGGDCRPRAKERLERDLGLSELRWLSTRSHQSISEFEPQVARPDVGLVMLAIRWASHSFEGVSAMCDRHGKPFVRLPRGYGVNQVASEIVRQASGQLAGQQASVRPA